MILARTIIVLTSSADLLPYILNTALMDFLVLQGEKLALPLSAFTTPHRRTISFIKEGS